MTLKEYKEELKKFDWYYIYSDSRKVYSEGILKENKLQELSEKSKSHKQAYETAIKKAFPKKKEK